MPANPALTRRRYPPKANCENVSWTIPSPAESRLRESYRSERRKPTFLREYGELSSRNRESARSANLTNAGTIVGFQCELPFVLQCSFCRAGRRSFLQNDREAAVLPIFAQEKPVLNCIQNGTDTPECQ